MPEIISALGFRELIEYAAAEFPELITVRAAPSRSSFFSLANANSIGDMKAAFAGGAKSLVEIVAAGAANMTTEEYERVVKDWVATAKHPKTGRLRV